MAGIADLLELYGTASAVTKQVDLTGMYGATNVNHQAVLTALWGTTVGTIEVTLGSAQVYDCYELVEIVCQPVSGTATLTGFVWSQIGGPTVDFITLDERLRFITPATEPGTPVSFRCDVNTPNGQPTTATITHTIRGWCGPFRYVGDTVVPTAMNGAPALLFDDA